jgi:serine/threonine protein kinase
MTMRPPLPRTGGSRHYAGLLLRVVRPGGLVEEFYLAGGLTIGRSVANTVVLADDEAVDRTHARVEVDDAGGARLRCVEPDSSLNTDPGAVRELLLEAGIRFHIGRSAFECVPGRRDHADGTSWIGRACPFCGSTSVPTGGQGARSCPDCHSPVLPVRFERHDTAPLLLPVVYGDFRAERYVARGGMALVLGGVGVGGMPVAIKVFLPGAIADRRDPEGFDREVAMLARVRHPNVVKLLDHGQSGRIRFIILEWVDGPSLRRVIADANRAGTPVDFAVAARWFNEVGKGLAAIHAAGVVHRDIKPSNILIGADGVARVADLGIASRVDAEHTS